MLDLNSNITETADIETSSDEYARRFSGEVGEWFLRIQEEATLRMLAPYPRASILDVGGGHGQLTNALIQNGYIVTVLGSAEICKARIQKFIDKRQCFFRVENFLDLSLSDQQFDVVVSFRLLPHVNQWQRFLLELTRVAKKSVILDYPEIRSINFIAPYLFDLKKRVEGNTRHYQCFRESELLPIFKSKGFLRMERFAEFFLPMVLHRKLNAPKVSSAFESTSRFFGLTNLFGSPVIIKMIREGE
jgi:2-polyprenyl-3-methyl-5-hydroxy-6-metoxy-1,4-benzoquinol methylase